MTLTLDDSMDMVFDIAHRESERNNYHTRMTVRYINYQHGLPDGAASYTKVFRWDAKNAQVELASGQGGIS